MPALAGLRDLQPAAVLPQASCPLAAFRPPSRASDGPGARRQAALPPRVRPEDRTTPRKASSCTGPKHQRPTSLTDWAPTARLCPRQPRAQVWGLNPVTWNQEGLLKRNLWVQSWEPGRVEACAALRQEQERPAHLGLHRLSPSPSSCFSHLFSRQGRRLLSAPPPRGLPGSHLPPHLPPGASPTSAGRPEDPSEPPGPAAQQPG